MKKGCAQGLAPSKHPVSVPLRRKTKRDWRGQAWQRDQLEDYSNKHGNKGEKKSGGEANIRISKKKLHDRKITKDQPKKLMCI